MIWAGILLDGHTAVYVIERGTVIAEKYRDEILQPCVSLFRGAVGPEFSI